MKASAIDRIMSEILKQYKDSSGVINIMVAGSNCYAFNPDTDEYSISSEDDVLLLENERGTQWIGCDSVTSIEI
jgi:hypothetical protein